MERGGWLCGLGERIWAEETLAFLFLLFFFFFFFSLLPAVWKGEAAAAHPLAEQQ
jgi:hypothetical protein